MGDGKGESMLQSPEWLGWVIGPGVGKHYLDECRAQGFLGNICADCVGAC